MNTRTLSAGHRTKCEAAAEQQQRAPQQTHTQSHYGHHRTNRKPLDALPGQPDIVGLGAICTPCSARARVFDDGCLIENDHALSFVYTITQCVDHRQ